MTTIANHVAGDNTATGKGNRNVGIILGCQRINATWRDVIAMARNGYAVVRVGPDVRLFWSGAYETVMRS